MHCISHRIASYPSPLTKHVGQQRLEKPKFDIVFGNGQIRQTSLDGSMYHTLDIKFGLCLIITAWLGAGFMRCIRVFY